MKLSYIITKSSRWIYASVKVYTSGYGLLFHVCKASHYIESSSDNPAVLYV